MIFPNGDRRWNGRVYKPYTREQLEHKHTGTLTNMLRMVSITDEENPHHWENLVHFDHRAGLFATRRLIKSILNTREHVPDKLERKLLRQEKAKQHK